LRSDRSETTNLAGRHTAKVQELAALWQKCEDQLRQQAGPPEPKKTPAKKPRKQARKE